MTFPIVGVGASAGGIEALKQFFEGVPEGSGMAFVVVQHRSPTHDGNLVEVLQRSTSMPVAQITEKLPVEPDHVYVIPPDRDVSILRGRLLLLEPSVRGGLRLPIDFFFRALAADQCDNSMGVILSGMGSDGTLGLRAIKEASGTVFVQDPANAKFDSMPRSAIAAVLTDVVAPANELAARMVAYRKFVPLRAALPDADLPLPDADEVDKVLALLRAQTGQDFSLYKKSTICRRIERRMALHQLPGMTEYLRYLRQNPLEGTLLFKELLIGVTRFFRDPEVWAQIKEEALPALLAGNAGGATLRAWCPACSTGEEAYTLAMIFREALEQVKPMVHYDLQVFATDLDSDAIGAARAGNYPANIAADVSDARLSQFFVAENGGYRVGREIRDMVVFAQHNVVMDPPFTKLDILSCRNLLIYLDTDLQRRLLQLFHYSLNPNGLLVLGSAETVGVANALFEPLPGKTRLYRRRDVSPRSVMVDFPPVFSRPRVGVGAMAAPDALLAKISDLQLLTNELLLQQFAPAAALTTEKGDVIYLCGKTDQYLQAPPGKASLSVFSMAQEDLVKPLEEVFFKAVRGQTTARHKALKLGSHGGTQLVDLTVQALTRPQALSGMVLIVFKDVTVPAQAGNGGSTPAQAGGDGMATLSLDLQHAYQALKAARDEMQTSQEELKSSNEELQSTNEELQSTNEELTTSREEMQSMNEELRSVNHELTAKVEEMSKASDDMKNLLNSTSIATLFLDEQMRVRRFTTQATSIFKLISSDVGRPITDQVTTLDYPALASDAKEVLSTLVCREVQVRGEGERWFNVRTMPYRTHDNRIDGVVITFGDISAEKSLELKLQQAQKYLHSFGRVNNNEQFIAQDPVKALQELQGILQRS